MRPYFLDWAMLFQYLAKILLIIYAGLNAMVSHSSELLLVNESSLLFLRMHQLCDLTNKEKCKQ